MYTKVQIVRSNSLSYLKICINSSKSLNQMNFRCDIYLFILVHLKNYLKY